MRERIRGLVRIDSEKRGDLRERERERFYDIKDGEEVFV